MAEYLINFIGDVHLTPHTPSSRKDNYPKSIETKYRKVVELYPSDFNIYLGDIFHKPIQPLRYINKMAAVETENQDLGGHRSFVIVGNHDVQYADMSYLDSSALGNWLKTRLVEPLEYLALDMDGLTLNIVGWIFNEDELPVCPEGDLNIVVGHAFYETSPIKGKDYVLTAEMLDESDFDIAVLGHDHAKYKPVSTPGGKQIYRPGSLSRGTSHFYNMWREVSILRSKFVAVDDEIKFKFKYVDIPSLPVEEAFLEVAREKKETEFKKEMAEFVEEVKRTKVKGVEVYVLLDQIKLEPYVKRHVENILNAYGMVRPEAA